MKTQSEHLSILNAALTTLGNAKQIFMQEFIAASGNYSNLLEDGKTDNGVFNPTEKTRMALSIAVDSAKHYRQELAGRKEGEYDKTEILIEFLETRLNAEIEAVSELAQEAARPICELCAA